MFSILTVNLLKNSAFPRPLNEHGQCRKPDGQFHDRQKRCAMDAGWKFSGFINLDVVFIDGGV